MGAGASGQPVYLTRSTMLISHTPMAQIPGGPQFRRQSTLITSSSSSGGGISSQLAFPIQLYPNNVYQNHGQSAQVHGFEPASSSNNHIPVTPRAPQEVPPAYSSIYPTLAHRVN